LLNTSCDDHGGHLVAQLRMRKSGASLRIARRAQQIEQIARRIVLGRAHPFCHDLVHQAQPASAKPRSRHISQGRDRDR